MPGSGILLLSVHAGRDETVQINIRGKITPSLRAYVEKKVGKIGKYFAGLDLNVRLL